MLESNTPPNSKVLSHFHFLLTQHFSIGELKSLCFQLGINYEELSPGGISDKARELIGLLGRRGNLSELQQSVEKIRPNVVWPNISNIKLPKSRISHRKSQPISIRKNKIGIDNNSGRNKINIIRGDLNIINSPLQLFVSLGMVVVASLIIYLLLFQSFPAPPVGTAIPTLMPTSIPNLLPSSEPIEQTFTLTPTNTLAPTDTPVPTDTPSPTDTPVPTDTPTPIFPDLKVVAITEPICVRDHRINMNYARHEITLRNVGNGSTSAFGSFSNRIIIEVSGQRYSLEEWNRRGNVINFPDLNIADLIPNQDIEIRLNIVMYSSAEYSIEVIANSDANPIPESNMTNNIHKQSFQENCS